MITLYLFYNTNNGDKYNGTAIENGGSINEEGTGLISMDRLYSPLSCLLLLSIQFVFNNSYNIDRIVYNVCMIMTTLNDNVCMEYECKL